MRILFFGSAPIAVTCLEQLHTAGHDIVGVVTQPDRPAGRGGHMRFTAVKEWALANGLPVHQPASAKDPSLPDLIRQSGAALAVVVAYGCLIPKTLLEIPAHGFINVHASILPKYRGAAPVPHAILNDEKTTGVTIFRLNERFDAGEVLGISETPIGPKDTTDTVLDRLSGLGAALLLEIVGEMEAGWEQPIPQNEEEATRAPKLEKEQGEIDWSASARSIDCMVRAFQPWPLAYTFISKGKKAQRLVILETDPAPKHHASVAPGTVLLADGKQGFAVQCGDLPLYLRRVKPEGKREMSGAEFVRGSQLDAGQRLGKPTE